MISDCARLARLEQKCSLHRGGGRSGTQEGLSGMGSHSRGLRTGRTEFCRFVPRAKMTKLLCAQSVTIEQGSFHAFNHKNLKIMSYRKSGAGGGHWQREGDNSLRSSLDFLEGC